MSDLRVIVTGSRDWDMPVWINVDLSRLHWHAYRNRLRLVLVHGDCPTGADRHVKEWADRMAAARADGSVVQEPHPADWGQPRDRSAGPRRNRHMVSLGADLCLAYPKGESRGTRGCATFAVDAGIPTLVTEYGITAGTTLEHRLRVAGITILEEER